MLKNSIFHKCKHPLIFVLLISVILFRNLNMVISTTEIYPVSISDVITHQYTATVQLDSTLSEHQSDSRGNLTIYAIFGDINKDEGFMIAQFALDTIEIKYAFGNLNSYSIIFNDGYQSSHIQIYDEFTVEFIFLEISPYINVSEMSVKVFAFLTPQLIDQVCEEYLAIFQSYQSEFQISKSLKDVSNDVDNDTSDDDTTDNDTSDNDSSDNDTADTDFVISGYSVFIFTIISLNMIFLLLKIRQKKL